MATMKRRKSITVAALTGLLVGMAGLSYAAVPLYRMFCQITGYGGTTQVATAVPDAISDRVVTVRFNADIASGLPWNFRPKQREIELRIGETALIHYVAENPTGQTLVGTSTFNVTPHKVGPYFAKVECFCFTEQTLAPGESAEMAVTFFVDPMMLEDPNLAEINTITLSYMFFPAKTQTLSDAEGAAAKPAVN